MADIDWPAHSRRIIERLGVNATWKPADGGAAKTVRGVYVSRHGEVLASDTGAIASAMPRFTAMTEDLAGVKEGDRLELAAGDFKIAGPPQAESPSGRTILELIREA